MLILILILCFIGLVGSSCFILGSCWGQAEYGDLYAPFEVMLHLGIEDGVRLIMLALVIWAQA